MENVAVLLSTYKGAMFLGEQLESIANQKHINLSLIIRDDGSPDSGKTLSIINKFKESHSNLSISIIKGENIGFVKSFTKLIEYGVDSTKTNYFAFADQDDIWKEDKLYMALTQLKNLESSSKDNLPMMYCSNTTLVDSNLNFIKDSWNPKEVEISKSRCLLKSYATGCTILFNRKAGELYLERFKDGIQVHDYFMYMTCVFFGKVIFDPVSHILYRQHNHNMIGKKGWKERWKRRLTLNWDKTHAIQRQAILFLEIYRDKLPVEDIELISRVAFYKSSLFTRFSLLFDKRFSLPSLEQRFVNSIKILGGNI
ncbi:MAG: glycosyltransferase [Ruminococcus sp.]|nr:glycosyltransferase [Ruminococcus sp.]